MRARLGIALVAIAAAMIVPSARGTLPGHNGLIAFSGERPYSKAPAIWSVAPDGTSLVNLTPGVDAIDPAWSPDGTKIAYVKDEGASQEIWVMNANGSGQTRLTSGYYDDSPAWSPNGSEIAFSSTRPYDASAYAQHIWMMNSSGSSPVQLTDDSTTANHVGENPDWSPDGTHIVFDDAENVYAMDAGGSNVTPLTSAAGVNVDPSYSPNGEKVAFASDRTTPGNAQIYVMSATGGGPTQLTNTPAPTADFAALWSPDGAKIAFVRGASESIVPWVMNADGSGPIALITADSQELDLTPSWQRTSTPPRPTSTSLSCTPPTVLVGEATTCTATVSNSGSGTAATPTGTVGFTSSGAGSFSGGGACTLAEGSCQLTYTPSSVGSGSHRITASYEADWDHGASSATQDIVATVIPPAPSPGCHVPKVARKKLAAAKKSISRAHCRVGTVHGAFSKAVKRGYVISQKPRPGRRLARGAKVSLVVSKGRNH